nr:hypothetical protein [Tanacetum cinerariifolium]
RGVGVVRKELVDDRIGVRKGFSGVKTPLFETMLAVKDVAEEAEAQILAHGDDVQEHAEEEVATDVVPPTPTSPLPSSPVLDTCSAFVLRVEGLENANAAQQLEIAKLKARVKKLERLNKVKSSKLRHLNKKVFANMRRVRKGFSGVKTPLFETMLAVKDVAEEAEAQILAHGDDVQEHAEEEVATDVVPPTPTSPLPSSPVISSSPPYQSPCPPQP